MARGGSLFTFSAIQESICRTKIAVYPTMFCLTQKSNHLLHFTVSKRTIEHWNANISGQLDIDDCFWRVFDNLGEMFSKKVKCHLISPLFLLLCRYDWLWVKSIWKDSVIAYFIHFSFFKVLFWDQILKYFLSYYSIILKVTLVTILPFVDLLKKNGIYR